MITRRSILQSFGALLAACSLPKIASAGASAKKAAPVNEAALIEWKSGANAGVVVYGKPCPYELVDTPCTFNQAKIFGWDGERWDKIDPSKFDWDMDRLLDMHSNRGGKYSAVMASMVDPRETGERPRYIS